MLLRAAWILTVSQSDWPESRMYLIPAGADSSAVDSIESVSYFLTKTSSALCRHGIPVWTCIPFTNGIICSKITQQYFWSLQVFNCQNVSQAVSFFCTVKPWRELFRAGLQAFWVVSHCLCDFLWLLSL